MPHQAVTVQTKKSLIGITVIAIKYIFFPFHLCAS
jgi:hypothetical protein